MTEKLFDEAKLIFLENFKRINNLFCEAVLKSGRKVLDVTLMAATKTVSAEMIDFACENGISAFGENRVQEFLSKLPVLKTTVPRHFIGTLQTNKVKNLVGKVDMIQSVDSLRLAKFISERSLLLGIKTDVLVEINIGNEETKSGISHDHALEFVYEAAMLDGIHIRGLMCIPPFDIKLTEKIKNFEKMQKLFVDIRGKNVDNVNMDFLSMGMSDDFETAILCGANIVRIGTALFGKRSFPSQ